MKSIIWLLLCGGYGGFLWAAKKRHPAAEAVLSFLDGIYLALLSLVLLPRALGTAAFYPALPAALGGIVLGFLAERKRGHAADAAVLFAALTAAALLFPGQPSPGVAILLAFFGSIGLYHACAGILPEGIHPAERLGKTFCSACGFLCGTVYFAVFL